MSLKSQLKSIIESTLTTELVENGQVKPLHTGTESSEALAEIKVADIVFSFNNWKLINALRKRGAQIASQDFDAMRAQEKNIQGLFDSSEEFRELTRPTAAFITFEEEDGKIVAMKKKDREQKFLEKSLVF